MEELVALTKDLIRFKTLETRSDEIDRCACFIEDYLKKCGAAYRRLDFNGIPSILALPSADFAPVILMSHIDVVDGADELFEPKVQDGKLYGRGSLDDKYAVALSLLLFRNHLKFLEKQGKTQADMSFGILITGDEETGGENGVRKALDYFRTDFCIALDGGSLNEIVVKEKGIFRLRLVGRGKAAHGARPWLGINAIERLMEDYAVLKEFFVPEKMEYQPVGHWHRSMNLGIIRAGRSVNQVPDYAEAILDIRFTEHDDMDALLEAMRRKIQGELVLEDRDPLFIGGESPFLDLLLETVPEARTGAEHGASDARHLSERGIRGVVWGPDGGSCHSVDEHVDIDSFIQLYSRLDRFVARIAATGC